MRSRWLNIFVLLSLLLGMLPLTVQAAPAAAPTAAPAAQETPDIEVEDALRAQLAANETTGYLIYFKDKPDLSPAYKMDWIERGRFVANALNQTALRSQANVRAYLDARGITYKAFWIENAISVETSNRATFDGLMAYSEIDAIRQHRQLGLVEPEKAAAPSAPQAVEPNILHVLADQVWAQGYTGEGIVVANVDTGVRYSHDALVDHYRGNLGGGTFDHDYNWWDPYGDHPTEPGDDNGHGSHTMGTMVGDDGGANQIGMAPGAKWIACRACNTNNCTDVALLECAQFIAAPWDLTKSNANPDMRPNAVNNSWGDCSTSYDPWYRDVVDAWQAAGIYPVFSNGNASNCGYPEPPGLNTVGNPGRYGNVTGVGSTGRDNGQYAPHSNWGPTDNLDEINPKSGHADLKPQVVAPGVNIRSSVNTGDSAYQGGWGGTSMSAPHVTGLIALMWSAAPCLIGDYATTETIIEDTATPIPYDDGTGGGAHVPNQATGWGEINALAAVEAAAASCGDSTITGEVLDATTNATIEGAAIVATNTAGTVQRKAASNALGVYVLNVFSDTYTLAASRYGYQTTVVPNVAATTGATTTQHIALTPAEFYEVSGQVTDAATSWPLYAHISISGDPVGPAAPDNSVWTDPTTGEYSLVLAEGITYTFEVEAWVAGYSAATDEVGPLTADAPGTDFALQSDMGSCAAPGYYFVGGLMANFEDDAFPPAGWTVVNNGGDCVWVGNDPGGRGNLTGGTGKFAIADSDYCGSGTTMDTELVSPLFDVSGLSQVHLSFAYDYNFYSAGEQAAADVSADGGATWVNVVTWNTADQRGFFSQDVTAILGGATQARVRFHYVGSYDYWWEVDDVVLGNPVCNAPTDGGLVVGHVYDENYPTMALNGAGVANATGGETIAVATPLDAAVGDAFYTLFAPSGAQVFTATLKGYHPDVATVTVVDGGTVAQDFELPAGMLDATPDGVAVTVELGFTDNATLNLANTGGGAATFELKEHEGRFAPIHIQAYTGNLPADDAPASTGLAPHKAASVDTVAPMASPLAAAAPAFAIDLDAGELGTFMSDAPGVWTTVGGIGIGGPYAGDFLNGDFSQMYVIDYDTSGFYVVDTATGAATLIGTSTSQSGQSWTGMAGAPDGTLYAASTNGSQSYLYTVDPATGATTVVGEITNAPVIIAIAVNADGQMYGVDIGSDVLVAIDPATGAGTVVGSTGFSANYAQGMDFEEESGVLYWAAYGSSGELRIIDTATGASTSVGAFPGGDEVDCLAFATGGAADVPWLTETPVAGSVPAAGNAPIGLGFDAAYVDQPGEYHAELIVKNDTPYGKFSVPVTMTVVAPQSWGKLTGTVTGLGVCDGDPAPLEEAEVRVESATTGQIWLVTTDVNGAYHLWIDRAHSPLTVTVTAPDYFGETGGVVVQQGQTTVVDFDLRILLPCLSYNPADFDVTLAMGDNTVEPLTLSNTGAATAEYELFEIAGGLIPLQAMTRSTQSRAVELSLAKSPATNTTPATWMPMGDLEFAVDDGTAEDSIGLTAGGQFLWLNRFTPNAGDFPFHLDQISIIFNNTVNVGDDIQLVIWQDADGDPSNGAVFVYAENATVLNNDFATWNNYQLASSPVFFGPGDVLVGVVNRSGASGLLDYPAAVDQSSTSQQRSWIGLYSGDPPDPPTLPPDSDFGIIDDFGLAGNWTLRASGATGTGGGTGGGIPWLTETPVSGTIAADNDSVIDLTFDAGVPETMQPGTYFGELKVDSNAANDVANIPVTLTVEAPATWGKIEGVVTGLGYCDVATPILLEEAEVTIESGTGLVEWTLLTDENGAYQLWLDAAHSPVDITIAYPDHITQVFNDVVVTAGGTTTRNAALRWAQPCLAVDPDMFDVTVTLGTSTTVPFTLTNAGAGDAAFDLAETNGGVNPLLPQLLAPTAAATGGTSVSLLQFGESNVTLTGSVVSPHFSEEDILLDQAPNADNGIFSDAGCDGCTSGVQVVAENFSLDAEETIGQIVLWSGYYSTDTPIDPDHLTVIFHADASGSPGTALSTETDVSYERVQTGVVLFGVHEWMHTLTLANPVTLAPGTYWVEIYNDTGSGTDDFFWETGNVDTIGNGLTGSAWATQAPGSSWNLDTATEMAIQLIRSTSGPVGGNIPWLSENPVSGAVDADDTFVVDVTFDASDAVTQITQPGEYFGTLFVNSDDPVNDEIPVPVTMTVVPPATWGKLMGTVTSLGYCDADPAPLVDAEVLIESWMTETVMLTTTTTLLSEGFEGTFPPAGWTLTQTGGSTTSAWVNTTGQAHSGSYSAYQNDNLPSGITSWFILPQITVPTVGALAFWQYENWSSYYTYHGIWVSTTSADPADFVELVEIGAGTEDAWEQVSVDLSAYAGQTVYLAFNYQGSYADEWYVDDVSITGESAALTDVPISWSLTTDVSGTYQVWLDEMYSPVTITVSYPDHEKGEVIAPVTGQNTTTQDFDLRLLVPCVEADPLALHATLELGATATEALTLTNTGAADADWEIAEAGSDVVWLAEAPISGTMVADTGEQLVDVDFDAAQVDQPGEYYADLWIDSDDPTSPSVLPVTMTVTPPASWGQLTGQVSSTGHCDVNLAPLPGADVLIESWLTDMNTVTVPLLEEGFDGTFPPAGWVLTQTGTVIDDAGWVRTTLRVNSGSYAAYHNDDNSDAGTASWMIMPQVAIPAGGAELAFWQNENWGSYAIYHGIWVSTASADPADFVEVIDLGAGTEDTWEEVTLDLSAYAGQSIYIAFHYEGDYADEWYVDDVSVSYEMQAVTPVYTFNTTTDAAGMYSYWMPAGSYTVTVTAADHVGNSATATVIASGAVAQDFSLTWLGPCVTGIEPSAMEVTVAMGMSTTLPLTMTNDGAGALNFQFSEENGGFVSTLRMAVQQAVQASTLIWNAEKLKGECAVYVDSPLAEPAEAKACYDFVPESQVFNMPMSPSDIGYALEMYNTDTLVTFPLNNFTGQTVVGALSASYYGVDFDPTATVLYALNDNTDQLGTIDLTTGAFTALVPCAAPVDNWTGLTIDPINGTFYASDATDLYIINPATGASTLVGPFGGGSSIMIEIAMNTAGEMYGHDIATDSIYRINPATGAATLIGATGYAANFAQGMDFDNSDGTLYIFLYQGGGANVYGTVNLATGAVTPLAVSSPSGEFEGAIQVPGAAPIPWLFEDPESGAVPAATTGTADITFDAGVPEVTQPGDYAGVLTVNNDDPVWDGYSLPVTMHVTLPATYGQITGTVMGLGPCDDPATAVALEGAEVTVQSATQTWTLFTDADGVYTLWLDAAHSPVSIMANAADYVPSVSTGVVVTAGETTLRNFALHPLAPCMSVTPADAHVTLAMGVSTTLPITVGNTGMAALDWSVKEKAGGFQVMAPMAGEDVLVVSYDNTAATAMEAALTNLGYTYLDVESSAFQTMAMADLLEYRAVFYAGSSSGDSWAQAMAYLNAGGALYISDNDLGYYNSSTTFYQTYLQATYVSDSGAAGVLTGVDIMAGVNPDVSSDPYPDDFIVGAQGVEIFETPGTNSAGVKVERNGYRAIYTSFDFAYVAAAADEQAIVERIMDFLAPVDVTWLTEDPTYGTVALAATAPVTLTFDASVPEVTQPGDYYATLTFEDGVVEVEMPVTMTVEPPATWGKIGGLVQGLGYCNVMTTPLEGAVIFVESTVTTDTWAVKTDAAGMYGVWFDEMYSPVNVTISYEAGYGEQVFTGVEVNGGEVTPLNANLLFMAPCMTVAPEALAFSVPMGTSTTVALNLENLGAANGTFLVNELSLGIDPLGPLAAGGPDIFGYRFADSNQAGIAPTYAFVDIADVGTPVTLGDNDFEEVAIGFDFKFYGDSAVDPNVYHTVFVNSNGFLSFGAGSTDISPDALPSPTLPDNLIAVAWDDLKPGVGGTVYVENFAQCPYNPLATTVDACFIAQYTNYVHADGSPAGTFEVILFRTGSILMQYADVDAPDAGTGIEGPLGLSGLNYDPALADELAICFAYPGEWLDCQSSQVPWLTVAPTEGDVAAHTDETLAVVLDASVPEVSEPGVYMAQLTVETNDPYFPYRVIPVTMTVGHPASLVKLAGIVTTWGQCDAVSETLAGVQVAIATSSGESFILTTDAMGAYATWVPLGDAYTMTVSYPGYVPVTLVGTVQTMMQPRNVDLRANLPCISLTPASFDVTVAKERTVTRTLTIHNAGAGDFAYDNIFGSSLWLSVAPKMDVVPANGVQDVILTFDATGAVAGDVYSTVLEIAHLNPVVSRLLVRPVRMTVLDEPVVLVDVAKMSAPADFVLPGGLITYTVVFTNSYDRPLVLTATDFIPADTTYVPSSVTGGAVFADPTGDVITWNGSLEAGVSATFSYAVEVGAEVVRGDLITNTVTVEAAGLTFTADVVVLVGPVTRSIFMPLVMRVAP